MGIKGERLWSNLPQPKLSLVGVKHTVHATGTDYDRTILSESIHAIDWRASPAQIPRSRQRSYMRAELILPGTESLDRLAHSNIAAASGFALKKIRPSETQSQ